MPSRHVVVVTRLDAVDGGITVTEAILGPFRREARAEARAATVRRLAAKYDEPPSTLHVTVEPLRDGQLSAQDALDYLYGGLA